MLARSWCRAAADAYPAARADADRTTTHTAASAGHASATLRPGHADATASSDTATEPDAAGADPAYSHADAEASGSDHAYADAAKTRAARAAAPADGRGAHVDGALAWSRARKGSRGEHHSSC